MRPARILYLAALPLALAASPDADTGADTPHYCSYIYVGGSYAPSPSNFSERVHSGQMYVERLTPSLSPPPPPLAPILLLHGNAQTGTNFLTTPNGRSGWASHFLSAGHTVILPDQTFRGRSPTPSGCWLVEYSAEFIARQFTAPRGWPQAQLHTQWPGAGTPGDEVFDRYYKSTVPFEGNGTLQQERMREVLLELVTGEEVGDSGVVVVAHLQAGLFAWALADAVPGRVRALVVLEPSGPPFRERVRSTAPARRWGATDIPLVYEPHVVDPETEFKLVEVGLDTPGNASCLLQREARLGR